MTKRILIFSTAYFPHVGGAEVAIKEIIDRLPGWHFDLITAKIGRGLPNKERIGNVIVHRLGFGIPFLDKLLSPFWGAIKIFSLSRRGEYDLFWSMMATFTSGAPYVFNILRFWKKVPIVLTLQEGDSEHHINFKRFGLIGLSWRLALKKTTLLTVISNYLKGRALHYGYRGEIKIIPNGVEVERFIKKPSEEKLLSLKKKTEKKEGDVFMVTSSRLAVKNGLGDVIESLKYLPENVKFLIIGIGGLEKELKLLVASCQLQERVMFLGWEDHDWLIDYLHISDIFIRPSLSEGQGISFLEAMAARLPVIATPVGGIPDFLKDGETGIFCQPEDPRSISEAVKKLMADQNLQEKIVANAEKLVREKYDWDNIAEEMKEAFKRANEQK